MIFDQALEMQVTTIKKIPKNKTKSHDEASKTVISSGLTLAPQDFSVALSDMKSVMTGMFDRQDAFVRQAAKEAKEAAHEAKMEAKEAAKEAKETALAAAKDAKEEAQQAREAAQEVAREYKEAANKAKQDAKEAAAEMRNLLQTMMKMMLSGHSDSSNPKRKIDQVRSGRLPYSEQRQRSPMWIHPNRDRCQEGRGTYNYMGELDTMYASAGEEDGDYGSCGTGEMDDKDEMTTEDIDEGPDTSKTLSVDEQTSPMDNCTGIPNHTPPSKKTNRRKSPIQPPSSVAFASKETPLTAHITRTGPAPTRPSSKKIHAVALDFENVTNGQNKAKRNALFKAPNPDPALQGKQE
jgi:flagellar biosynthesis GTPase FlhF